MFIQPCFHYVLTTDSYRADIILMLNRGFRRLTVSAEYG